MSAASTSTRPSSNATRLGRATNRARAVPGVFRVVFLVALCCGAGWAVLTPPFQVPDETEHFAYVQYFAETGDLPGHADRPGYSREQVDAMRALGVTAIIGRARVHVPVDPTDRKLDRSERASRDSGGGPTSASQQPPLYYVLAAVPYRLFGWADVPGRMLAIRLLSSIFFAGAAVMAAALAVELLPQLTFGPLIAGLAVALQPVMGFIGGGVSPDSLLAFLSAVLLFLVVRGMRRPSPRAAAAVALAAGAVAMTKLSAVAVIPGAAVAVLVIVWRLRRQGDHQARRAFLAGLGAGVVLPLLYLLWTTAIGRGLVPAGASTGTLPADRISAPSSLEQASYIWQLYLPRVPWQTDLFGFWPPADLWLRGILGVYGWLDYSVPVWIFNVGKAVALVLLALGASAAVQHCRAIRRHWAEIAVLSLFVVALALVVGLAGYTYHRTTGFLFEQARYLFPLAALGATAIAFCTLGLGRRFAPFVAAVLVGLFAVHEISGVLLTYARYYG